MPLLTIREASRWASNFLNKEVDSTNISYLLQYGKVKRHTENGSTFVSMADLKAYYGSLRGRREIDWKKKLGEDLNWTLSFDYLREKHTTKHVHRLHPYKGKFIPQLVQYFIDDHVDDFKTEIYFRSGDIVLDPFSGSGTTLVQASEMGIHSIGIDVSQFNCMISEAKLHRYNFESLQYDIARTKKAITDYVYDSTIAAFESELSQKLAIFNQWHFPSVVSKYPSPEQKWQLNLFEEMLGQESKHHISSEEDNKDTRGQQQRDAKEYTVEKEQEFLKIYDSLVAKYNVELKQAKDKTFLDKWYLPNIRKEIDFTLEAIRGIDNIENRKVLAVILSRTIRSCRATTHFDLATLRQPQTTTYYCWKHKKICKPLYSIKYWFGRYSGDTIMRLREFDRLRKTSQFAVIPADSRTVNITAETKIQNKSLCELLEKNKIRGIFTSPPYVGQIDYHEQHAYAYDLLDFPRKDNLEIGPLYRGQGSEARLAYVEGVAAVLNNCKHFLQQGYNNFIVANDKYGLYPAIAKKAGMKIVNTFKRPVLNRTERDRNPYSETIFHLKER